MLSSSVIKARSIPALTKQLSIKLVDTTVVNMKQGYIRSSKIFMVSFWVGGGGKQNKNALYTCENVKN